MSRWRRRVEGTVAGAIAAVLLLATLGALAGLWWGGRAGQTHTAQALVLLNPLAGNPFSPDATGDRLVNLETEARLVTSDAVAQVIADRESRAVTAAELLVGVSVDVPANTQLLDIEVTGAEPELVRSRAQAFAETYLEFRQARTEAAVFDRRAGVDERIRELTGELASRARELDKTRSGSPQAVLLQQQITDLTNQMALLRTQFATLQGTSTDPGQVVTPAALLAPGPTARPVLMAAVGGAGGAVVGVALAIAGARRRTRVTAPVAVSESGHTVVAVLPAPDPASAGRETDPREAAALRAGVLGRGRALPFTVLLGSLGDDPGSEPGAEALVARELAAALARSQMEVATVDLVGAATTDQAPGVVDVLTERADLYDLLQPVGPHNWALGAGVDPTRLDDLVPTARLRVLLEDLRKQVDVVIVRGGRLADPRASVLLGSADLLLAAGTLGAFAIEDLDAARAAASEAGAPLIGVALVEDRRREGGLRHGRD